MFDYILDKVGLVRARDIPGFRNLKTNPYTEEELCMMLADKLELDYDIDEKSEKKLFSELKNIEGLIEYLKDTSSRDMVRYFGATTPQEQMIIRGAYARTNYLKGKIISGGEVKKPKLESVRYN